MNKIIKFAKSQGYDTAKFLYKWNGFNCYEPILDKANVSFTGLPLLILEDKDGNIRMSTSGEAFQQLKFKED